MSKARILLLAGVVMAAACRPATAPPVSGARPVSGAPPASAPWVPAFLEDRAGQRPISPGQLIAVAGEFVHVRVRTWGPAAQDPRAWIDVDPATALAESALEPGDAPDVSTLHAVLTMLPGGGRVRLVLRAGFPVQAGEALPSAVWYDFEPAAPATVAYTVKGQGSVEVDPAARCAEMEVMQGAYWFLPDPDVTVAAAFTEDVAAAAVEARLAERIGPPTSLRWSGPRRVEATFRLSRGRRYVLDFARLRDVRGVPVDGPGLWLTVGERATILAWSGAGPPVRVAEALLPPAPDAAGHYIAPGMDGHGRVLVSAIAAACGDGWLESLWIWDTRTGAARLLGGLWPAPEAQWLPDGKGIVVSTPDAAWVVNDAGQPQALLVSGTVVVGVAVAADGRIAVLAAPPAEQSGSEWPVPRLELILFDPGGTVLQRWTGLARLGPALPVLAGQTLAFIEHVPGERGQTVQRFLRTVDVGTGSSRRLDGPLLTARRVGPGQLALRMQDQNGWHLYDAQLGRVEPLGLPGDQGPTGFIPWAIHGQRFAFATFDSGVWVWDRASGAPVQVGDGRILGWDGDRLLWIGQ